MSRPRPTCLILAAALLAGAGCGGRDRSGHVPVASTPHRPATSTTAPAPRGSKAPPDKLELQTVGRFEEPVLVTFAPGRDGIVVVEKGGRALQVAPATRSTLVDLRGHVSEGSEQGLLGLAFHPEFERNGRLYVNYTDRDGDTHVDEYRQAWPPRRAARRVRELLRIHQPYANHNGGQLTFGPDGYLWIGTGDGGSADDPHGNAQNTRSLLGKLLRIDVDAATPYAVPSDNPFAGGRGGRRQEIWAQGLRNPWRFSFDRATGMLVIGDVGQGEREEIDMVDPRAAPPRGYDFGWDRMEGTLLHERSSLGADEATGPVLQYSHDDGSCSVTGGYVYRGDRIPALRGWYVFADYCQEWIRAFRAPDEPTAESLRALSGGDSQRLLGPVTEYPAPAGISSFGEDERGELYVATLDGLVARVVAG